MADQVIRQREMPRTETARFDFLAEPHEVRRVLRGAVARFARRLTAEDAGTFEVALAEVLNNVVEHAHAGIAPSRVSLILRREPGALWCRVEDGGHPMPGRLPPGADGPAPGADPAGLPEGGWGWILIRALATDIGYERLADRNLLTFRVQLSVAV